MVPVSSTVAPGLTDRTWLTALTAGMLSHLVADAFSPCGLYNSAYDHPAMRAAHGPLFVETGDRAAFYGGLARKRNERTRAQQEVQLAHREVVKPKT